jgi:hypothetical protein
MAASFARSNAAAQGRCAAAVLARTRPKRVDLPTILATASAATAISVVAASASAFVSTGVGLPGTRFIYVERPPVQILAVQSGHGLRSFGGIGHLDETEAAGLAAIAIANHASAFNGAEGSECRLQICVSRVERQVADKYVCHFISPGCQTQRIFSLAS